MKPEENLNKLWMKSQHRLALRVCLDWEEDLRGGFGVI